MLDVTEGGDDAILRDRPQLRSTLGRWCATSLFTVPIAVLVVILLLGAGGISGSSIALQHGPAESTDEPLLGTARPIRSDEWLIRTPLVIRQAREGFPVETQVGMGAHDTGVLSDLPVKTPAALIKPHSWAYFVVGVEHAFAIEWWLAVLGPFLGVYGVLAILTRRRLLSSLAGLLASASPGLLWWAIPTAGLSVLYIGVTSTLLIAAIGEVRRRRFVYAAAAGWSMAAFVGMLYLPWLIPLGLVFGALVASQLPGKLGTWRRSALVASAFVGCFAVCFAIYVKDHAAALRMISESVYPGARRARAGEAVVAQLFGAPFDVFATSRTLSRINGTNESQNSSGLMLWVPIAIAGGTIRGWRSRSPLGRAVTAVLAASIVLALWALAPVPSVLGQLLGLTNVTSARVALPLTVASALLAGLYVHHIAQEPSERPSLRRALAATAVFAAVTVWVATEVTIEGEPVSTIGLALLAIAAVAAVAMIVQGRVVLGIGAACLFVLFGSVRINPIQVGLDPVTASPLVEQIEAVRNGDPSATWAALGVGSEVNSLLVASGAPTVTGVSWYADAATWVRLDPNEYLRSLWDRFAIVRMVIDDNVTAGPGTEAVQFDLPAPDQIVLRTPACGGALELLDVGYVVAAEAIDSPCLQLVDRPDTAGEGWMYDVVQPSETE